ncbi:MAG: hypothetical protein ACRDI2_18035 [Chloroflexota bacterium]
MTRSRRYLASVPERIVRALAALGGGAIYELSQVALPRFVRRSKLYQATVARMLRITIELVGDVRDVYPAEPMPVEDLFARKAAGNVVEFASIFAVGWSPLWLLAAAADLTGGSRVYLRALARELRSSGLLPADADVSTFEGLLTRLELTSGVLADTIDVPPFRPSDLRASWQALRRQASDLPSAERLAAIYAELQAAARREGRSLQEVSSAIGLGAARAGLQVGNAYIFDYYRQALRTIAEEGLVAFLRRTSRPYLRRAGGHFDPQSASYTERLLRRAESWLLKVRQRTWRRPKGGERSSAPALPDASS